MVEAVTWSFIPQGEAEHFGGGSIAEFLPRVNIDPENLQERSTEISFHLNALEGDDLSRPYIPAENLRWAVSGTVFSRPYS